MGGNSSLIKKINLDNEQGKIILISRLGLEAIERILILTNKLYETKDFHDVTIKLTNFQKLLNEYV